MRTQKGITLIALVITIIVMLILVAVSVTVALNGGLFRIAKQAAEGTKIEKDKEQILSSGEIQANGNRYASYEDYINDKPILWEKIETPKEWTKEDGTINDKITAMQELATGKIIPLPQGFQISENKNENTSEGGLVITDGINEFVWIECTEEYTEDSFGPLTGHYWDERNCNIDSQGNLNYWYGLNDDETPFYDYSDFTYDEDKTRIEESVNKYDGFYVGRYETTIDNGIIGVQEGKTVLTDATTLREGINNTSNAPYCYRWWGLYKIQKDMYAENEAVFSSMISSKQWELIIGFTEYGETLRAIETYTTKPDLSGSAYKTDNTQYDVSKNIYDLAGNVGELTITMSSSLYYRGICGGYLVSLIVQLQVKEVLICFH